MKLTSLRGVSNMNLQDKVKCDSLRDDWNAVDDLEQAFLYFRFFFVLKSTYWSLSGLPDLLIPLVKTDDNHFISSAINLYLFINDRYIVRNSSEHILKNTWHNQKTSATDFCHRKPHIYQTEYADSILKHLNSHVSNATYVHQEPSNR